MFKKMTLLFSLSCCLYFASVQAEERVFVPAESTDLVIPEQFFVTQRWLSFTNTFDIRTETKQLGLVYRKVFSLTTEYHFHDVDDHFQAKAKMRFFSFGAVFNVTDNYDQLLGIVNEKIFKILPTFEILSPQEQVLAYAKMNIWGTRYSLYDPVTNEILVEMTRSFFRLRDKWTITLKNPDLYAKKEINPCLFITVMAFQTDMDYWRSTNKPTILSMMSSICDKDYRFIELRAQLEPYRYLIENREYSEEAALELDSILENYLAAFGDDESLEEIGVDLKDTSERDQSQYIDQLKTSIYQTLKHLLPLLENADILTPDQKVTLFFMMDKQLTELKY